MKANTNLNYYTTDRIDKTGAKIRIVYGMRSNGKTTAGLMKGIKKRMKSLSGRKEEIIYIRRWDDEIRPKNDISSLFDGILKFYDVEKESGGAYNSIKYKARKFYLAKVNDEGELESIDTKPLCSCLALSQNEHYKSLSFPDVTTIVFDEFISENHQYLPNEFKRFTSILSTIIRSRDDVEIYLMGNTVDRNCIYWNEFRILEIVKKMKDGDIYHYKPKGRNTDIAIEWAESITTETGRVLNVYTDFDTSNSDMINRGLWDTDNYPHLPFSYSQSDVLFTFFIEFNTEKFQCEVISKFGTPYIYIHQKTADFKPTDGDLIYGDNPTGKPNYSINLWKPEYPVQKKITDLFYYNKVFYQNNIVGDSVNAFLNWCKKN